MQSLVPVRRRALADADAAFHAGWLPRAHTMYEHLVDQALAAGDHALESASRAMLARCLLRRRDVEGAELQLERARAALPEHEREIEARLRASEVRLYAVHATGAPLREAMRTYYDWAAQNDEAAAMDAANLLADHSEAEDRVDWYRRAIDHGRAAGLSNRLGGVCHALAATLESLDRLPEALEAYRSALDLNERHGDRRQVVASRWAVGAVAARLEDHVVAQENLQAAVDDASKSMDCEDLLALALADLALVHQEWGDDIEARRLLLQALAIGREIAMAQRWPDRWNAMREHARRLDI